MITITKIKGLSQCYPEPIEGTAGWYCCKEGKGDPCDLYEAEEIVRAGKPFSGMNSHLPHYPDAALHSPFAMKKTYMWKCPYGTEEAFPILWPILTNGSYRSAATGQNRAG